MVHVIKYVTGTAKPASKTIASVTAALTIDGPAVAKTIEQSLQAQLIQRPALQSAVHQAVTTLVATELRFIKAQRPALAVAAFLSDQQSQSTAYSAHMVELLTPVLKALPAEDHDACVLTLEIPLISLLRDAASLIQRFVEQIVARHYNSGGSTDTKLSLGAALAAAVVARLCAASKLTEAKAREFPHRIKWPKHLDMPAPELVDTYFGGTPLATLLLCPIAVRVSDRVRMEHCLITAGAGHGKTQTLQHMIACDLDRPKGQEVGMVIIDSQGDLINRIKRLGVFANSDRLLIVDAADVQFPVALNLFNLGGPDMAQMTPQDREQAMLAAVQLYEYVIGGLFGAEMTSKQSTVFKFLIRLMISIPGATVHTLRQCLEEPEKFIADMERQPATARQFLTQEFVGKQFNETRKQILRRLYGVLSNQAFERMFASSENRLDLYQALNDGRVVVCNTSREFLQEECRIFGRYLIAISLKAAFDRARLAPENRRTSYLYVDEASDYFDESVGQLLVQARKYKLGLVLAHQALEQMSDGLRALVMSNTSVKLTGGVSAKDARALAPELRTSPDFILGQEKTSTDTAFATFVRNVTPAAVSWRVPFLTMEHMPEMSADQLAALLARNRAAVSGS
jgi:hypothetical protein